MSDVDDFAAANDSLKTGVTRPSRSRGADDVFAERWDEDGDHNNDNNDDSSIVTPPPTAVDDVEYDTNSYASFDSAIYREPALLKAEMTSGKAGGTSVGGISSRMPKWYGTKKFGGLHYMRDIAITGRLIVVEGPDASGRSTQIELLTAQLEAEGYAVLNTGLTRSELIGQGILEAKRNISLGMRTLAMFYAADFADQLEHKIIPALQAGYVVLADRYIYTLMARNTVRGIKRSWSSNLYSFALVPDLIFYLDVDPYALVHRVFAKRQSLDYYESGADMGISNDMYESFIRYQQRLAKEFEILKQKYDLNIVDGNRSVEDLNARLQKRILGYLSKAS